MQVGEPIDNLGDFHILAIGTSTGVINGGRASFSSGYDFSINNLPPDSYMLVIVQDRDGDSEFCETNDICFTYGFDNTYYPVAVTSGNTTSDVNMLIPYSDSQIVARRASSDGNEMPDIQNDMIREIVDSAKNQEVIRQ